MNSIVEMARSIEEAQDAVESNSEKVLSLDGTTPATTAEINKWLNFSAVDGLVTRASQITSNASDPEEGQIDNLLDREVWTFWHSDWHENGAMVDSNGNLVLHDLELDLGKVVDEVTLKFSSRVNRNLYGTPRVVKIYGSNDGETWTYIGTQDVNWYIDSKVIGDFEPDVLCYAGWITTPLGYQHVKMAVEHTGGAEGNYIDKPGMISGSIYFNLSELRAYEGQPWKMITINSIADPLLKDNAESLLAQAQEELSNGTITPEMLAALIEATNNL